MSEWIHIGIQYPPFNEPVLVTDGDSWQIMMLMKDKKGKRFWKTDHKTNLKWSVSHWMTLPKVPE